MNKHNDLIARCIVGSYQHRASWGSCKYRTADCSTDRTADCLSYFKYANQDLFQSTFHSLLVIVNT